MQVDLYLILGIWLLLGVISALLVYLDMRHREMMDIKWALLCIPLSFIGFVIYIVRYEKSSSPKGRELPPKPDYGKPEYKFEEAKQVKKVVPPAPVVVEEKAEPAPEPVRQQVPEAPVEAEKEMEPVQPEPAQEVVAQIEEPLVVEQPLEPVKQDELAPPSEAPKPVEEAEPQKPKVHQIEGIPRCGDCGAAISAFDEKCPGCGKKLKG